MVIEEKRETFLFLGKGFPTLRVSLPKTRLRHFFLGLHPKPHRGNHSPCTPDLQNHFMVLRYRVEGVTP